MSSIPRESIAAIILAAGASSRMGSQKLLLPWGASSVIGHIVKNWWRLAGTVCAVVRDPGTAVTTELERTGVPTAMQIVNSNADAGMFSSIQVAAASHIIPETVTHIALVLGDQPQIDGERVIAPLIEAAGRNPIHVVQPAYGGAPKHPLIFPRELFASLARSKAPTLREALTGMPVTLLPIEDELLNIDLDTPQDYEQACRIVFARRS